MTPGEAGRALSLTVIAEPVALCQLSRDAPVPAWIDDARQFVTVSRTPTELSVVADERVVPATLAAERGYRVLRVDGPLPLGLVGIVAALAQPLAAAGIPIFPIATFETDYVLVREPVLHDAIGVLRDAGHLVRGEGSDRRGDGSLS